MYFLKICSGEVLAETGLKCHSAIHLKFFIFAFGKDTLNHKEVLHGGWWPQLWGMVLQMWTVRLNVLLFLESFLIENVHVLSFILAAECSAS